MEIELQGVPSAVAERVRESITVGDDGALEGREARTRVATGRQQLKTALSAFGYYRARVTAELTGEPGRWKALYRVTPGAPIRYEDVTLDVHGPAESEPALREYLSSKPLAVGEPVVHERYEAVKDELLKRTLSLGYLDAALSTHRVEIDLEAYRADATIVVDSGPLYRFGEIRLIQDVLDDDFVRGYVDIDRGDPYADQRLLRLQQALKDSDYFSEARVEPRFKDAGTGGHVPVDVYLTARDRSRFQTGVGFGTDTGPRASLSWEHRRLNRRGHRLGSMFEVSEVGASLEGHYTIPFGDPRRDEYEVFASYVEDNPDTSDSQLTRIGVIRSSALRRTRFDLSLTYLREDFTVADQTGLTDLFIPGAALSRVTTDDRLFARSGLRWNVSVQGAAGLISDFAFVQPRVSGKLIHSLGDMRLILRGDAAITFARLERLPASLRFFAGGDHSVRGFGYETLGPENDRGEVTGGRHLMVGSAEIDYGVTDKWRVAAFVDAGNAFDDFEEPLRKSVGIGVRRITPIGPVRLDVAHPLFQRRASFRLHITLGPDL